MTNLSFFIAIGGANVLLKLNYLKSRDTIQKDHIYSTKQYQTFYRKIKCDLVNFIGVKYGYHQDFQYLMVSIQFFIKWQCWYKDLCLINCDHKKKCSRFFWWKNLTIPLSHVYNYFYINGLYINLYINLYS